MSLDENRAAEMADPAGGARLGDAELDEALKSFRQSVHAWSDAAYSRPRTVTQVAVRRSWRLATAWALGCVLATGSLSGGLYQHHRRQVLATQVREAQQAKARELAAEQRAQVADEDLLATVDSDISRTVPAAMEPLAQLMDESESQ
jgi:hypothetical protein